MQRIPVASSNLAAVGYDPERRALEVEFTNGGVYTYHDVAPGVHAALMGSHSKGAFLHSHIRPGHRCTKEECV